ncbi:hypothetical protein FOQG_19131 [Fusarium oxysporum f. sp. raphani 54005]|uniref:Uncharacterized protein n=2 Tax=Fusarium oxysporum TaxID=5507 RepID=X0BC81_FUSOX|nr:hypothetical protein FOQG_19131 [Fusarium oxysporum f. sp. raphani 54005]
MSKGGHPETLGVHEHFAAAPIPPGAGKFTQLRSVLSVLRTTFISGVKELKTVKDNPAEPMAVKNWETVDVARLMKVENTFQDSIFVDG